MVLHYLLPLFRVYSQKRWPVWPPHDFDYAEPGHPRIKYTGLFKVVALRLRFVFPLFG